MKTKLNLISLWCFVLATGLPAGELPPVCVDSAIPAAVSSATTSGPVVAVSGIIMAINKGRKGTIATATVTVLSKDGTPVAGARVTGVWSGLTTAKGSALTNAKGRATFHSARVTQGGTFRFDLGTVTAMGASYDAEANAVTYKTIDAAETTPVVAAGEE